MAVPIIIPKEGQSMETCRIVKWHKKKGDTVSQGDILCEVETDKAAIDIEAPAGGIVLDIFFEDDTEAPLLTPIAAIGKLGEEYESLRPHILDDSGPVASGKVGSGDLHPGRETDTGTGTSGIKDSSVSGTVQEMEIKQPPMQKMREPVTGIPDGKRRVGMSPRAKRLAKQKSVPLSALTGTGPEGHIVEQDVLRWLSQNMGPTTDSYMKARGSVFKTDDIFFKPEVPSPQIEGTYYYAPEGDFSDITVKGKRKVIAEKMLNSLQQTAQITLNASAEASELVELRKRFKESPEGDGLRDITINDIILYSAARALIKYKELNSHFLGDKIRIFQSVHLGLAVDTSGGLIVPVIKNAHLKSLKELSEEAKRLIDKCRKNKIGLGDLKGGTFTVTNLGQFGIDTFTPILNPPEVGVLGVGNITLKPVQSGGDVKFVPHIGLSLTINHQAVDGTLGARFLQAVTEEIKKILRQENNNGSLKK